MANLQFPMVLMVLIVTFSFFSTTTGFVKIRSVIKPFQFLTWNMYRCLPVPTVLVPVYSHSSRGIAGVTLRISQVFGIRTFSQVIYRVIGSYVINVVNKLRRPVSVVEKPCDAMSIVHLSTEVDYKVSLGIDTPCNLARFRGTTARNSPSEKAISWGVFQESMKSGRVNEGLFICGNFHNESKYIGVSA